MLSYPEQAKIYDKFLKKFTEEILIHVKFEVSKIEQERLENSRVKKEIDTEKLKMRYSEYMNKPNSIISPRTSSPQMQQVILKPRVIEETKMKFNPPQNLTASADEINFGKLLALIRDPLVRNIDCPGENKDITIRKAGKIIKINLTLAKEEIDAIIKSFSEKTHIPLIEGMLKARFKEIEITAIISENDSSFVLRKEDNQLNNQRLIGPNPIRPYGQMPMTRLLKPQVQEINNQENKKSFFDRKITLPF